MKKRLSSLVKRLTSHDLLVTPRMNAWLLTNGLNQPNEQVAAIINEQMLKPPRDRTHTFSASAAGQCARRQVFAYLGLSQTPPDPDLALIFEDGRWRHLRWQANLLSAGILHAIEVPVSAYGGMLTGTMDGIGDHDDRGQFIFELKGINNFGYQQVCNRGPKQEHLHQVHSYMYATGIHLVSLIYENKNTQEWREFVVTYDEELAEAVEEDLHTLMLAVDNSFLPPVRSDCAEKKGAYKSCPFAHLCLTTTAWPRRSGTRIRIPANYQRRLQQKVS